MNSLIKKINTLRTNPTEVYYKYKGKFKAKLVKMAGGVAPIYGEDYDRHWNFTSFENKVILDLGADYGSTAYYFLCKGATKVIAVEGDKQLVDELVRNFADNKRVVCINCFINDAEQVSSLIKQYHPELVKVDIEGFEKVLLNVRNIADVNEWLIEVHTEELYESLKRFFVNNQFNVKSYQYINNLKILHVLRC